MISIRIYIAFYSPGSISIRIYPGLYFYRDVPLHSVAWAPFLSGCTTVFYSLGSISIRIYNLIL